jgi:hypothetical protein
VSVRRALLAILPFIIGCEAGAEGPLTAAASMNPEERDGIYQLWLEEEK